MTNSPQLPKLDDFGEVVLLDTEYISRDGNPAVPVCLRAHEFRSGRNHAIFFDRPGIALENPLPTGGDVLYVAYSAHAEWGVYLPLGWNPPTHVLDLGVEFRCITNGLTKADNSPVDSS